MRAEVLHVAHVDVATGAWMVEGSGIGDCEQAPERRRRLSSAPKRRGLSSRGQRAALIKRLGFWSGGWLRQPL